MRAQDRPQSSEGFSVDRTSLSLNTDGLLDRASVDGVAAVLCGQSRFALVAVDRLFERQYSALSPRS